MYSILLEKRALKDLDKFPNSQMDFVLKKIDKILSINPFPKWNNPKFLKWNNWFRLRVWKIRVLYKVQWNNVLIYSIWLRKNVYDNI